MSERNMEAVLNPPQKKADPLTICRDGEDRGREVLDALLEISNYVGSVLPLDQILSNIVTIAARTMRTETASFYLWNDARTHLVMKSTTGYDPELMHTAGFERGRGIPGWSAEHGETVALADAHGDPRYEPLPTSTERGFRAYICTPLRIQDEIIGVMTARRRDRYEFSNEEATIFQTIAKLAAIVIEKAHLYHRRVETEVHEKQVLEALLEISHYVGSVMMLDEILARIARVAARVMAADTSSIYLFNEERNRLVMSSTFGLEEELIGKAGFDLGRGIPGWVAERGELVALRDARVDPRYEPLPSTAELDFRAYICAPLRIQDEIIGVMTARRREAHEFDADEITMYETICKQVAIVIEKARLSNRRMEAEKLAAVAVSLSGVAHYIKNVLLTMHGSEFLIDEGLEEGNMPRAMKGWELLKRANRKISNLVENMLNYYRETELKFEPVELNRLIEQIAADTTARATENGIRIERSLDPGIERIEADANALHDVVLNLVTNAIDAIGEKGEGRIEMKSELLGGGKEIRITVADNGCGIPEEDRAKVFNLFFTTKGKSGTGIGLAAVRRIILDHNGRIDFTTETGAGTTFTIHLPVRQLRV